jgi:hypothetical protein
MGVQCFTNASMRMSQLSPSKKRIMDPVHMIIGDVIPHRTAQMNRLEDDYVVRPWHATQSSDIHAGA